MKLGKLGLGRTLIPIGLALIVLDLASPVMLAIAGYWDHDYVETYRGYDIYYYPNINVYGIDILGTNPPGDDASWVFYSDSNTLSGLEAARAGIDNWLENPVFVESYNGYDVYREPAGAQRYYGVSQATGEETSRWTDLAGFRGYIDGPQGYFSLNGRRTGAEDTIVVASTSMAVTFTCMDKPDLVQQVYVTVQEVGGSYTSEAVLRKVDGADVDMWKATINLPGDGTYRIDGYLDRYLETVRLLSINASISGVPWFPGLLSYAGATLTGAGLLLEARERQRR